MAVQWLELCASIAGDMGSIPAWGTKIPHAEQHDHKKNKIKRITMSHSLKKIKDGGKCMREEERYSVCLDCWPHQIITKNETWFSAALATSECCHKKVSAGILVLGHDSFLSS